MSIKDNDYIYLPVFDETFESTMRYECILKNYIKGNPFMSKPYKSNLVSYVDAESSHSGVKCNDNGIAESFTCDRCKKEFKADKAKAVRILLNEASTGTGTIIGFNYERAFCGRCYKKTQSLTKKIYDAICEFDPEFAGPFNSEDEI